MEQRNGSPSSASAALIVARYLQATYPAALPKYLEEANLSEYQLQDDLPDLRTIVQDWSMEQMTRKLAKSKLANHVDETAVEELMSRVLPEPVGLQTIARTLERISAGNLLVVMAERVPKRVFDTSTATYHASFPLSIIVTAVDRTVKILDYHSGEVEHLLEPHKAAVICVALHPQQPRYIVTGSMDGSAVLTDLITRQPLQTFKHQKFVVKCVFSACGRWMATASHDRSIVIYEDAAYSAQAGINTFNDDDDMLLIDETDHPDLARDPTLRYEERLRIDTKSNPESMIFHPSSTYLLYTLRSHHLLHYVSLPGNNSERPSGAMVTEPYQTLTKSFNPHPDDTHVSFSILNLAIHPSGKIIACQTGDHAGGRAAGERVLLYGIEPEETERLAVIWTGEVGDDYFRPRMDWLPDGRGLIVTTTTGHLVLLDLKGKVRSKLKVHGSSTNGSATSEIVRDIAIVAVEEGFEAVSVGYDGMIRISK